MLKLSALVVLAWLLSPGASLAADRGIEETDRCVRSNFPKKTSRLRVDLKCQDRNEGVWTYKGNVFWRRGKDDRSETLMEVEEPSLDRGTRYLSIESAQRTDTWVCLPALRRVRHLAPGSTEGQLLCSDFSSEDIQHMQRITGSSQARRLPDASLDGRGVRVIRSDTSGIEGSRYDHIVYYIDDETCVPLKIEFFETAESLRKLMTADADSIVRSGEGWVAKHLTMEDRANGTTTRMKVREIDLDAEVPARLFSLRKLETDCL